uniref:Uncharacterized protein n=1 Tax=Trypanosoma vivax (strain Y486) TaxID=1055687 RepID=G0U8K0_TRYVY|nr:hypothetical protein TVY486_1114100 [Trypanosoma vivax Y486]
MSRVEGELCARGTKGRRRGTGAAVLLWARVRCQGRSGVRSENGGGWRGEGVDEEIKKNEGKHVEEGGGVAGFPRRILGQDGAVRWNSSQFSLTFTYICHLVPMT